MSCESFYIAVEQSWVSSGQQVARGEPIGRAGAVVHASVSGAVRSVEPRPHFEREPQPALHVCIEASGDDAAAEQLPGSGNLPELCDAAGVVGMGGGGFPTAAKLRAARGRVHTLMVNVMDTDGCADRALAAEALPRIDDGAEHVASWLGIDTVLIAAADALPTRHKPAVPAIGEPKGEERRLVEGLTGTVIAANQRPLDHGYLVLNAATCFAIADGVDGNPVTQRLVDVAGTPTWLPIGAPLPKRPEGCWQSGGHLSGERLHSLASVRKTTYALTPHRPPATAPCIRCGACRDACPVQLLPDELYHFAGDDSRLPALSLDACLACGLCDAVCPSGLHLAQTFRLSQQRLGTHALEVQQARLNEQRSKRRDQRIAAREQARDARRQARLDRLRKRRG